MTRVTGVLIFSSEGQKSRLRSSMRTTAQYVVIRPTYFLVCKHPLPHFTVRLILPRYQHSKISHLNFRFGSLQLSAPRTGRRHHCASDPQLHCDNCCRYTNLFLD